MFARIEGAATKVFHQTFLEGALSRAGNVSHLKSSVMQSRAAESPRRPNIPY
jgi:hypothetical protein